MEEKKATINWVQLLTTVLVVLVTAGVVGGAVWYFMNQNDEAQQKSYNDSVSSLQKQIDGLKGTVTGTITPTPSPTPASNGSGVTTTKGALDQTYTNKDCAFTLNYPSGYRVTTSGVSNATISSANFWAPDNGFTASCTSGESSFIKSYADYSTTSLSMKVLTNPDGSKSYYEPAIGPNPRLIVITVNDPNKIYASQWTKILDTLKLN